MSRKTLRYTAFAIPILILIIYLLADRSPFGSRNTSFAVDPDIEITRIEFSGSGSELSLEKEDGRWLINRKDEARKSAVQFLLGIVTDIQIKSPVTTELYRTEIIQKNIEPVRIKVFGKGKLIRSYQVYRTTSNKYGNIMKLREGSKPFIMYVPGNESDIGSAFTPDEIFWRPYTVFTLLPSEIFSVTMTIPGDTGSSFMIRNENRRLTLLNNAGMLSGWDTSRLVRYLSYFTYVPFESWALSMTKDEKDAVKSREPLYEITVLSGEGIRKVLRLWERTDKIDGEIQKDTDRLWGATDDNDEIFIIRYMDADPILKKRSYFYTG